MNNIDDLITTCESLMINTTAIEGIFDRFKKNKKSNHISSNKEGKGKVSKEEAEALFKQVVSDVKSITMKIKRDKEIKDKIANILKDPELTEEYSKSELKYSIICDIFEQLDDELIMEIIEGEQVVASELSFIINDIKNELKSNSKYDKLSFSSGDGDEGCLYVKANIE